MERNVTNLPAFPDLEYGQEVSLPEELLNEPYSFYDNGLRPEITVRRAPFSYSIDEYGTPSLLAIDMRIAKNNQAMAARPRSRGMRIHDVPEKRTSNYSVLNVYDTYGYDVARSFLKHIYYHKFNSDNQQWLSVYLEGSLKANGLDYFNPVEEEKGISYVFYLCYEIQRKLREIDQSQPKMKGQLQDIGTYLPADILNRIIPSERVSKSIASQVRYEKCDYTPTNEELDSYHDYNNEGISLLEESIYASFSSGHDKHLSIEQVEDDLFEVRDDYDDLRYSMTYKSVLYTLETYEAYYRSQGCNVSSSMQGMLKKLLARLDTNHEAYLDEILPWFLLLARDSDDILGEYTLEDIWTELRRLVNATIDRYN
ncbi:Hypothetical protein POVR2_LOCUS322 [uncultured virus]|nr:Hypothetical protein POVR2_LOCUS322 [uncultured virus]